MRYVMPEPRRSTSTLPIQEFGQRVRTRRLELGLSQERLAEISGLHRNYVGSLERGERNVALLNILRLAKGLNTDAAELVRDLTV